MPSLLEPAFKAEVGHDRRDDRAAAKLAATLQVQGDKRHHLVAVDDPALLVDDDEAIGVAIQRDADVRAACDDRFLQELRDGSSRNPSLMLRPSG